MKGSSIFWGILAGCIAVMNPVTAQTAPGSPPAADSTLRAPGNKSGKDSITDMGVAVAPSTLRFRVRPGSTETKQLTVTNDTKKPEKFKVSVADYDMSNKGAITQLPYGKRHEYGLSKWISISPTFVELAPGEAKKISITVTIPDSANAYRAAWSVVMIDQTTEKKYIAPPKDKENQVVLGIIPVFGFGIYIFQNPPNVKLNKVEIKDFFITYNDSSKSVSIKAKNVGDGIGFCKTYVEIHNMNTGKKEKIFVKQFTIFPGTERLLDYIIPGPTPKGKYIATAILDFGSEEELEAFEYEFTVK